MQNQTGRSHRDKLDFDPDALRKRYRAERERRLRPDAAEQYFVPSSADFSYFPEDPYAEPLPDREPIEEEVDALVIGGGLGGTLAAAHLKKAGITKVRIVERAGDFGGTWYWNRYPGLHCDLQSYIYLPFLEETGYMPSRRYVSGAEILGHFQRIGRYFGLYDDALFQTHVRGLEWSEPRQRWTVRTSRGDAIAARFVVISAGPLGRPKMPRVPGIEQLEAHTFHTSRWDYG